MPERWFGRTLDPIGRSQRVRMCAVKQKALLHSRLALRAFSFVGVHAAKITLYDPEDLRVNSQRRTMPMDHSAMNAKPKQAMN